MSNRFFEAPILNSPYERPNRHWELDDNGQPTQTILGQRRRADFVTPIPKPKHRKDSGQKALTFDEGLGLSSEEQEYQNTAAAINALRTELNAWRQLPSDQWRVTPETATLLQHWRADDGRQWRPFFCQREAVETAIWLTEVAPTLGTKGKTFLERLDDASAAANPGLHRIALKMATGSGKTMVMAMLIAWQTINAVRHPHSKKFTRGFLAVTPGITIRDRLQVLQPNHPDNYYTGRNLVPRDMLDDLQRARIVITNYHAFKKRERRSLSKGTRALLRGRGEPLRTLESDGQMLQRVMPELMSMKRVVVLNDEAHHCYRAKPGDSEEEAMDRTEKEEAEKNTEAAHLWISGIEALSRTIDVSAVFDLSATPFFLRGSGYAEGTLFPWTVSDFSLMDAIECGIVKLPRVPVADDVPGADMPTFRNLWENLKEAPGPNLPKAGRRKLRNLDPLSLPTLLQTALEALYGHYEKVYEAWQKEDGVDVPPCFIVVCQNTAISKLVYDYIAGFDRENDDGTSQLEKGRLSLFQNHDEHGRWLARPRTLLIDSQQLESGDALDNNFRKAAADEIERLRRELRERGDPKAAESLSDEDLLRGVMNTVGKTGRLGEQIRCVVSVSMLTEGWDANNVTHVLGVRAFGTQLLCEQVIGRALRRQSYDLNDDGLFEPEYADVLGIPFDFTAEPVVAPPQSTKPTIHVRAVQPDRDALEITFPRVEGYRVELPKDRLTAVFSEDSVFELTPDVVGPTDTEVAGIIGETENLNVEHLGDVRFSTVLFHLTRRLLETKWREPGEPPPLHLFGQLKRIARQWVEECLVCSGGTYPAQLVIQELADVACERITNAITRAHEDSARIKVLLDPYTPTGSTRHVSFTTSKTNRWETDPHQCHVNWAILDSDWEAEFCRVAEAHPRVRAYVKNHNLGLEVPYRLGGQKHIYRPDFLLHVDDGHDDPLNLVVEIKGYRGEDAKAKKETMLEKWVPGVNNNGSFGRWAFAELRHVFQMREDFDAAVEEHFNAMLAEAHVPVDV